MFDLISSPISVFYQQLESLAWQRGGTEFMTAHADGSYIIWSSTDATKPKEQANTPYGKTHFMFFLTFSLWFRTNFCVPLIDLGALCFQLLIVWGGTSACYYMNVLCGFWTLFPNY